MTLRELLLCLGEGAAMCALFAVLLVWALILGA